MSELNLARDQRLGGRYRGNVDEIRLDAILGEVPAFFGHPRSDLCARESGVS